MRIGRTLPPAAAPLNWRDLWHGLTGIFSPGRRIRVFEEEIRQHFAVSHVFLVSSGTAALTLTLQALKSVSGKTEVVIPAYTCFSVPGAVVKAGLRPVLCDVNPSTFDFDHALLEQTLTADTLCVIAHHLFGIPSEIDRIRSICAARGIYVIEDAAQAMGAQSHGRSLGTLGDVGIFSLGRGKNITCGSGGIIVTNAGEIADTVARHYSQLRPSSSAEVLIDLAQAVLMTIFIRPRLFWIAAALPFLRLGQTIFPKDVLLRRLSGVKAGLLRSWRSRLTESNRIRAENAAYFTERLSLQLSPGPSHAYIRVPVVAATPEERDEIYSQSQKLGLGFSLAYPTPINEIPEIRHEFVGRSFPSARKVAETILTLPTHAWLTEKDKRAIAQLCGDISPTEPSSVSGVTSPFPKSKSRRSATREIPSPL